MSKMYLLLVAFMASSQTSNVQASMDVAVPQTEIQCSYASTDRERNASLPWAAFDLSSDNPKTAMWYSANGCYAEAVAASRDYLALGPQLSVREHAITTFHMARNLARSGDRSGAALMAAASRRSDQAPDAALDWNTYVVGFYAYLIGDRAGLDSARTKLSSAGGTSNLMNATVLNRAARCFERPFLEVERSSTCAPAPS